MHIYQPYDILADTPDILHLKKSAPQERMHFVMLRIFPIILLLTTWFVLQQVGSQMPMGFNYLFAGFVLAVSLTLLFRSYNAEIKITRENIFITRKTFFGAGKVNIENAEMESIILKERKGKTGTVIFMLYLKNKKSYEMLQIPRSSVNENNLEQISIVLEQFTGIAAKKT